MNPLNMDAIPVGSAYEHKVAVTGLAEADIRRLIPAFYAKVRGDPVLGPVFDGIVGNNWPTHIETVCSFWLYATRLNRRYNGRNFMPAHIRHPAIRAELLPRWLTIFSETARQLCTPAQADSLIEIAERMANSLEISLNKRDS
jgi:hemoglobin